MDFPEFLWGVEIDKKIVELVDSETKFIPTVERKGVESRVDYLTPDVKYQKDDKGNVYVEHRLFKFKDGTEKEYFYRLHSKNVYEEMQRKSREGTVRAVYKRV